MHVGFDYHPWYPNVDPEFDEMGGELTIHQISDPLPAADEEPAHYLARVQARVYQARRYARALEQAQALREAKAAAHKQIREARYRLSELTARFDVAARTLNSDCCGCIPYNGYLTPSYWRAEVQPYRVEQFLR